MIDKNIIDKIDDLLTHIKGSTFDECDFLYHFIVNSDEESRPAVFKEICENYGIVRSDGTIQVELSKYAENQDKYEEEYGSLVDSLLDLSLKKNYSKDEFYKYLWELLSGTSALDGEGERIFSLYYVLIDRRIPYFQIDREGLYKVPDDDFRKMRGKYKDEILKIRYLFYSNYDMKTEKASALLEEFGINKPNLDSTPETIEGYKKNIMRMVELSSIIAFEELVDRYRSESNQL